LRELDDRCPEDTKVKCKISEFCRSPELVLLSHTATNDLGLLLLTKDAALAAIAEHIAGCGRVFTDRMDNGDTAYIINECIVGDSVLYAKMRFFRLKENERMLLFSAHPPRRWC